MGFLFLMPYCCLTKWISSAGCRPRVLGWTPVFVYSSGFLHVCLTVCVCGLPCAAAPQSLRPADRTPQREAQQVDGSLQPGLHGSCRFLCLVRRDPSSFCLHTSHAVSEINCRSSRGSTQKRRSSYSHVTLPDWLLEAMSKLTCVMNQCINSSFRLKENLRSRGQHFAESKTGSQSGASLKASSLAEDCMYLKNSQTEASLAGYFYRFIQDSTLADC